MYVSASSRNNGRSDQCKRGLRHAASKARPARESATGKTVIMEYGIWIMGAAQRAMEVHKSLNNNNDLVSCQTGHLNDWQAGRNCLMRQQDYCSMKES